MHEAELNSALDFTEDEQALLRCHFPVLKVQPWPIALCPLLLCRLIEDAGIGAPDASQLLQASRDQQMEALLGLRAAVSILAGTLKALPLARAPAKLDLAASASHRSLMVPPYAHREDMPGAIASHWRAGNRAAHSRRFVRCRWADWLDAASQHSAVSSSSSPRRHVEDGDTRARLVAEAEQIVANGIVGPQERLRPALWMWLAPRGEVEKLHPSWYQSFCIRELQSPQEIEAEGALRKQIQRDLERTPPEFFIAGADEQGKAEDLPGSRSHAAARSRAAERLLLAYGRRRPAVGYCQGLNFVAATLLSIVDEQSAFVIFCGLLERLPADLYSSDPEALARCRMVEQDRVRTALANDRPHLSRHMDALEMDFNLFLPRWLTCLFASVLGFKATQRLWDHVLGLGGGDAVPRLALALLTRAESQVLTTTDLIGALDVLSATASAAQPADVDAMLTTEWPPERLEKSLAPVHPLTAFADAMKEAKGASSETAEDVSTSASSGCQQEGSVEIDEPSVI